MKPILFHPDAAREANDSVDYYEGLWTGLGVDFRKELMETLSRFQRNPHLYARERGSIRVCPLHRFPYSVSYEELVDSIWVVAIGHQGRRPGYWTRRV